MCIAYFGFSIAAMSENRDKKPYSPPSMQKLNLPAPRLPDIEEFAGLFLKKYGRELTSQERRFYELTRELLTDLPQRDGGRGEAA